MSEAPPRGRQAVVLLVEDDEDHVFLTRESFRDARLACDLHHVPTGIECMQFLRREPPYADAPEPDLILLDLHMPRMNGFEVLEAIKADERLRHIPVVVMTSSSAEEDIRRVYQLQCASFITKPVDFSGFTHLVKELSGYWFQLVMLPPHTP